MYPNVPRSLEYETVMGSLKYTADPEVISYDGQFAWFTAPGVIYKRRVKIEVKEASDDNNNNAVYSRII